MPVNTKIDEELQKRYEKKKREKAESESSSFSYSATEDVLIMPEGYTVCRFLDIPKQCDYSFIKADDGNTKLFRFPSLEEKPDFILYKIINKVLFQKWVGQDSEGKAIIEVPMKEEQADIYWMIYNNEDMILGEYGPNGWGRWKRVLGKYQGAAASTCCYTNVINRREFEIVRKEKDDKGEETEKRTIYPKDWCVSNKHSLVLTKTPKSVGAPITISNLLMTNLFPNFGNFQNYDIAINRMGSDPYYQLFKAEECVQNQEVFPYVVKGPLTDAEKEVDVYDLKELTKPATYSYIYQNLKGKIEQIDQALGTQFIKELEQLVDSENSSKPNTAPQTTEPQPEQKEEPDLSTSGTSASTVENTVLNPEPEPQPEQKKEPPVREIKKEEPPVGTVSVQDFIKKATKDKANYDDLSDSEKAMIKGVSADGNTLLFESEDLVACPYCQSSQPTTVTKFCLYCGVEF
jgi:hypothetical protein